MESKIKLLTGLIFIGLCSMPLSCGNADTATAKPVSADTGSSTQRKLNGEYKMSVACNTYPDLNITKVKVADDETIISFSYTNKGEATIYIMTAPPGHKEAFFIMSTDNSKKYNLLNIEGIAIKPSKTYVKAGATVYFTLTFERIADSMTRFHVIEGEIEPSDGLVSWRFLNVKLK